MPRPRPGPAMAGDVSPYLTSSPTHRVLTGPRDVFARPRIQGARNPGSSTPGGV